MGDPRATPFGHLELDLDDDVTEPASGSAAPAAFGHVDFDIPDAPASAARMFGAEKTEALAPRAAPRAPSVHDASTRVLEGDALSNITRRPPAMQAREQDEREVLNDFDAGWTAPESEDGRRGAASRNSSRQPAAPDTGPDARVTAMRALYAQGDAAGALAVATTLGDAMEVAGLDQTDESIAVDFELEPDLEPAFGGGVPYDDDVGSSGHRPIESRVTAALVLPPPAQQLTLTERHSIPRLLTSAADVSKLRIDHRAGFLLAFVDGVQTLEEILDVCAMPASEALELFGKLKQMGVLEFE